MVDHVVRQEVGEQGTVVAAKLLHFLLLLDDLQRQYTQHTVGRVEGQGRTSERFTTVLELKKSSLSRFSRIWLSELATDSSRSTLLQTYLHSL